jgi:hypothetical protein
LLEYRPKNKWGKRRQNYYGSSLPKKEYGFKRSTTTGDDVLELEEEDALARQKKMESANACVNFDQFIDDDDKDEQRPQLELAQILNIQVKPVETKARSNNDLVGKTKILLKYSIMIELNSLPEKRSNG